MAAEPILVASNNEGSYEEEGLTPWPKKKCRTEEEDDPT